MKKHKDVAEDADAVFDEFQYEDLWHKVELEHHTTKKGILNFI